MAKNFASLFLVVSIAVGCGSGSKDFGSPTAPSNRPPVVTGANIGISPTGVGLAAATVFLFTAQGISDPDGDSITYIWEFGDGSPNPPSAVTVTKLYDRAQIFTVRLTINDGVNADILAAQTSVTVRDMTGTWDVSLVRNPSWPWLYVTNFTLVLAQYGSQLVGTAYWRNPCGTSLSSPFVHGSVKHPREINVGIESWSGNGAGSPCGTLGDDTYVTGPTDPTLSSVSGPCQRQFCSSFSMVRR